MSVFSKMYGYPTGYFNAIYNYLLNDGQIKTEQDVIQLVKDFGYPEEIVNRLAQEIVCTSGINLPDVIQQWDKQLQLDRDADEEIEMQYKQNTVQELINEEMQEEVEERYERESSQETSDLDSDDIQDYMD